MHYEKTIGKFPFEEIKADNKTVEGRLKKGDFAKFEEGDTVTWINSSDNSKKVKTRITKVVEYKTLYDMIKSERLKNVLPRFGISTIQEGVDKVYRMPPINYTEEKEKKFGVLAIRIELI
jgi:ASC-1-like (ASCH) protein